MSADTKMDVVSEPPRSRADQRVFIRADRLPELPPCHLEEIGETARLLCVGHKPGNGTEIADETAEPREPNYPLPEGHRPASHPVGYLENCGVHQLAGAHGGYQATNSGIASSAVREGEVFAGR